MIRGGSQQSEFDEHELDPNKDKNHHFSELMRLRDNVYQVSA